VKSQAYTTTGSGDALTRAMPPILPVGTHETMIREVESIRSATQVRLNTVRIDPDQRLRMVLIEVADEPIGDLDRSRRRVIFRVIAEKDHPQPDVPVWKHFEDLALKQGPRIVPNDSPWQQPLDRVLLIPARRSHQYAPLHECPNSKHPYCEITQYPLLWL
jgi:hypothetical protein